MASLSLRNIYKIYQGGVKAVSDFNLEIDDKEFVVFVGPSGCGKSTTLRMVAGLEEISSGELYIDGKLVNDVEPKDRDIAMVFQNYALYPHMTVYDNMAFGLKLRKMNSKEIDQRVQESAAILGITPLLTRKPKALSGGQRQRVALGRAIVREPKVFLLDEPLSNLDAKLRVQMRTEITKLHNRLATTFIYVTHDQTEAMTMGTRIVVMKDGIIQQADTPQILYDNPDNLFVASFLGSPQMNFFNAVITRENGKYYATFGDNKIEIPNSRARRLMDESYLGVNLIMGVRPEDIHDEEVFIQGSPNTVINAEIDVIEKLGNETILYMKVEGKEDYTIARIDARSTAVAGEKIKLAVDAKHIHFFDPTTELSVMGVPKANRIPAKLLASASEGDENSGALSVRFGNVKIDCGNDITDRLLNYDVINSGVILEIKPDDLMDKETFDSLEFSAEGADANIFEIDGVVDFVEKYPKYIASYNIVPGKVGYIISKHSLDSKLTNGDKIKLYCKADKIQLRDAETNQKLLSSKKLSKNTVDAAVTVKENVASISFGKSKLSMATNETIRQSGNAVITLDRNYMSINKADISKNPKMVLHGKILDADILGDKTLVYASCEGVSPYLTAVVSDSVNLNVGDKLKIAVDAMGVTAEKTPLIAEVLYTKGLEAPKYEFVEKQKAEVKEVKAEVKPEIKAEEEVVAAVDAKVTEKAEVKKPAAPAAKKPAATTAAAKKPAAAAAKKPADTAAKKPAAATTATKKPAATAAKKPTAKK